MKRHYRIPLLLCSLCTASLTAVAQNIFNKLSVYVISSHQSDGKWHKKRYIIPNCSIFKHGKKSFCIRHCQHLETGYYYR